MSPVSPGFCTQKELITQLENPGFLERVAGPRAKYKSLTKLSIQSEGGGTQSQGFKLCLSIGDKEQYFFVKLTRSARDVDEQVNTDTYIKKHLSEEIEQPYVIASFTKKYG